MSWKKITFVLLFLLVITIIATWFFFKESIVTTNFPVSEDGCMLYQSSDVSKPCFIKNNVISKPDTVVNSVDDFTNIPITISDSVVIQSCSASVDSDACIKNIALETRKVSLCSGIQNVLNKSDCVNSVGRVEKPLQEIYVKPTVNEKSLAVADINFKQNQAPITQEYSFASAFSDVLSSIRDAVTNAKENPDPRYTADGFFERLNSKGLALYAFSEYQVRPGSFVTAQGVGFTKTENTVYVNGLSVPNLSSLDGFTLEFIVPQGIGLGTHEVWVTNSKGTSRLTERPVHITVTNSPVSRPTITSVSPSSPLVNDKITLTGTNLEGTVSVLTTFGVVDKIQSTGTTITFDISDISTISKIKNNGFVKGKSLPIQVVVGTPQGYNKDAFVFNIQF